MAQITAAQVKELRDKTDAGMMDCKKALSETEGDLEAAVDWLRKKGLTTAARPFLRNQSTAASTSPPVSVSAFLQSIMPAPVFPRSSLTNAAVMSAISRSVPQIVSRKLSIA